MDGFTGSIIFTEGEEDMICLSVQYPNVTTWEGSPPMAAVVLAMVLEYLTEAGLLKADAGNYPPMGELITKNRETRHGAP